MALEFEGPTVDHFNAEKVVQRCPSAEKPRGWVLIINALVYLVPMHFVVLNIFVCYSPTVRNLEFCS